MTLDFSRQDLLADPDALRFPIHIVGAGGIGSPTALALAKMGCADITVYDPDTIEAHNVPNQLYSPADTGRPKAEALAALIQQQAGLAIRTVVGTAPLDPYRGVVIFAVDTMAARATLWHEAIRLRPSTDLLIDARLGGEVGRVYAIRPTDPDDIALYERSLYTDAESDPHPCAQQAVIYSVFVIAGLVAAQVRRSAVGESLAPELIFDLATMTLIGSEAGVA